MPYRFKLVIIDKNYCDYLRKYDSKVPYNFDKKQNRPFVGVLFKINNVSYFAPLSSPKPKHLKMHNAIDFLKIDNGNLGAINFNNMIPVKEKNTTGILLNKQQTNDNDIKYQKLLKNQLLWLNQNYNLILKKAKHIYNLYLINKLPKNVVSRCCDFKLLEEKCLEYNTIKN